jgi:hypothetical protein
MISIAEKIGALFDFVRVDLYSVPSAVFFGETTFCPLAGLTRFEPMEMDLTFGRPWVLPPAGNRGVELAALSTTDCRNRNRRGSGTFHDRCRGRGVMDPEGKEHDPMRRLVDR